MNQQDCYLRRTEVLLLAVVSRSRIVSPSISNKGLESVPSSEAATKRHADGGLKRIIERRLSFSYAPTTKMNVAVYVLRTIGDAVFSLIHLPSFWFILVVLFYDALASAICFVLRLFGGALQQLFFGELRVPEDNQNKDRLWNYIFYKFIFVFGVLNVSQAEAIASWTAWFTLIGLVHTLNQICRDRIDYITFSSQLARGTHVRLTLLLLGLLSTCVALHVAVYQWARERGLHFFLLCDAEVLLATVGVLYVIVRYSVHAWDMRDEDKVWENRAEFIYFSELTFQLASLAIDFAHDLHMLMFGNVLVSMASVAISMRLHATFSELKKRLARHRHFSRISTLLSERYPAAGQLTDPCAICWDHMVVARLLPCGHTFHDACLRSWLEHDTSCPTCRLQLDIDTRRAPPKGLLSGPPLPHAAAYPAELPAAGEQQPLVAISASGREPSATSVGDAAHSGAQRVTERNAAIEPHDNAAASRSMTHGPADARNPPPQQPPLGTHHHVFHFDGSRYLRWLPSVSLEVSHAAIPQTDDESTAPATVLQLSVDLASSETTEATADEETKPQFGAVNDRLNAYAARSDGGQSGRSSVSPNRRPDVADHVRPHSSATSAAPSATGDGETRFTSVIQRIPVLHRT